MLVDVFHHVSKFSDSLYLFLEANWRTTTLIISLLQKEVVVHVTPFYGIILVLMIILSSNCLDSDTSIK